ncbi:MAG: TrkA C-terminal domain-containing protein, partial [Balneolaceae bacterium]
VGITPNVDKIRRITGATIVAIERKGKTIYEIDENIEIEPEDTIIIVGSDETVNQFRKTYC